jgi:PAS domain S-box-containing protein
MRANSKAKEKILIVDDDKVLIATIVSVLSREGYKTDTVPDGKKVLAKVIHNKYDLILLDIYLPGIDGFEVCKILKSNAATKNIPVIFISSFEDEDSVYKKGFEIGALDYLKKPITVTELIFKIKNYLLIAKTETKLRQNEILFRSIVNNQSEFVVRYKPDGALTFVNASFCNYLKKNVSELIGSNFFELLSIEKKNEFRSNVFSINSQNITDVIEITLPSGEKMWHRWVSRTILDKITHKTVVQSIGQDITEIKKNEDELKQYEFIFKHAGWGIVANDPDSILFGQVNEAYAKMHGYSVSELQGKNVNTVFASGSDEMVRKLIRRVYECNGHYSYKSVHRRKDGKQFPALTDLAIMKDNNGKKDLLIANVQDITKTVRTTNALVESEERFRSIFKNSPDIIVILKLKNLTFIDVNDKFTEFSNLKKEDVIGKTGLLFRFFENRSDVKVIKGVLERKKDLSNIEVLLKSSDEHIFPALISCSKIVLNGSSHVVAIIRNIENIKQYQESLQRSETKFRLLADYNYNWEFWLGTDKEYIYTSPSCERITGYTSKDFEKEPHLIMKLIHPDYIEMCSDHFLNEHADEGPEVSLEFIIIDKYGNEKWIAHNCNAVFDEHGCFLGRRGNNRDTTSKKISELELLKLSTAIEQSSSAIVITNTSGVIEYVNPYFEKLTGYGYNEVLGKNPRILKSGKTDPHLYSELWKSISSGQIWQGEFINRKKNGEMFVELNIITPVKDEDSRIVNYIAIKQDITKQKEGDREILQTIISTEEKERIRFAQDLHDDLGPLLSTAKLYVKAIETAKDQTNKQTAIDKALEAIDDALISIKEIAYDLSPHILRNFGLVAGINSLINKINETGTIKINFNTNINGRFDENLESSTFRVIAELINNTIKHASANKIDITIISVDDELLITFSDDGIGYVPEKALKKKLSFGLSNITNRIKSLGGEIEFDTNKNNNDDVRVSITIPIKSF